jgi:hypothetical protein
LYSTSIDLITDDRDNKVVDRTKIKKVLEVLEFADYENPGLVKSGEDYYWINNKDKDKEENQSTTKQNKVPPTLKEYNDKFFSPRVKYILTPRQRFMLRKSSQRRSLRPHVPSMLEMRLNTSEKKIRESKSFSPIKGSSISLTSKIYKSSLITRHRH